MRSARMNSCGAPIRCIRPLCRCASRRLRNDGQPHPDHQWPVADRLDGSTGHARHRALPNDFELDMSARAPDGARVQTVKPGDACAVRLGGEVVITGYVDRVMPMLAARAHTIRVMGR